VTTGSPGSPAAFKMLEVQVQRTRSTVSRLFNQADFVRLQLVQNIAGVKTVLDRKVVSTTAWGGPFDTTQKPRLRDAYDGSTASTNYIEVSVNGIVVAQLSPKNSDIANSSGLDYSGAFTRRVCLVLNGNSDGTSKACRAAGGRIIRRPQTTGQIPNAGRADIIAFVAGEVWGATRGETDTLVKFAKTANAGTVPTNDGLLGNYVQAIARIVTWPNEAGTDKTRNRVLALDGSTASAVAHMLVDTIDQKVHKWDPGAYNSEVRGCELLANFGFRTLLAAPPGNKSMWYVSASKDTGSRRACENFDLSDAGLTAAERAFSGNSPGVGTPADSIIAVAEVPTDDTREAVSLRLLMFCSRSIYMLDGDPAAGGKVVPISTSTGIVDRTAWCYDNRGNVWWVGNGGLHAMPRGSREYAKTDGRRLPDFFDYTDTKNYQVVLAFRASDTTIRVYLVPRPGTSNLRGKALAYDIENEAFWPDEYPAGHGPSAVIEITGQNPQDRSLLLCGTDGFIRELSDAATSDDGEPIDSWIKFAPMQLEEGAVEGLASEVCAVGSKGSGILNWLWFGSESPEEALDIDIGEYVDGVLTGQQTPDASGVFFSTHAGRQEWADVRVTAGAHMLVLRQRSATEWWALGSGMQVRMDPAGDRRTP